MKKSISALCILFVSVVSFASTWKPGENMKQAIVNTISKSNYMVSKSKTIGYANGTNFFGAFVTVGGTVTMNLSLQANTEYVIVGGGGNNATDIDITVTSPYGTEYKDTEVDNTPIVKFVAARTGTYTVKLKLYSGSGSSFCCMSLLKSGGYEINASNFARAISDITKYCETINSRTDKNVKFLDNSNQWCMYGGLLGQGENMAINTINMGYGYRTVVAASDSWASDIDLFITKNGNTVAKDTEDDAIPIVDFYAIGENYEVKTSMVKSAGNSFVMLCILNKYN